MKTVVVVRTGPVHDAAKTARYHAVSEVRVGKFDQDRSCFLYRNVGALRHRTRALRHSNAVDDEIVPHPSERAAPDTDGGEVDELRVKDVDVVRRVDAHAAARAVAREHHAIESEAKAVPPV